jgi:Helix-turn-helix domain
VPPTSPQCSVSRMCSTTRMNDVIRHTIGAREIYDKPEAAEFLRIKKRTLDVWMTKGLPYAKLPSGAVRFRRDQLLNWLEKHAVR